MFIKTKITKITRIMQEQEIRKRYNGYMKFSDDPYIREMAIEMLLRDPSERTFNVAGELVFVNLINEIPANRDIYMKIAHIWSVWDKAAKIAYSGIR